MRQAGLTAQVLVHSISGAGPTQPLLCCVTTFRSLAFSGAQLPHLFAVGPEPPSKASICLLLFSLA